MASSNITELSPRIKVNYVQDSEPASPLSGESWLDTKTSQLKVYDGSKWHVSHDLQSDINDLYAGLGEVAFETGLERLDYPNGIYDTFVDTSYLSSLSGVGLFNRIARLFDDDVQVDEAAAANGASYTFDLSDATALKDIELILTGRETTNSRTPSQTGMRDGDIFTADVGGNIDPTGPSNNNPTITLTGKSQDGGNVDWRNGTYDDGLYGVDVGPDGTIYGAVHGDNSLWTWNPDGTIKWYSENFPSSDSRNRMKDVAADRQGNYVYASGQYVPLRKMDVSNGNFVWSDPPDIHPYRLEVGLNGDYIYTQGSNAIKKRDATDASKVWTSSSVGDYVEEIEMGRNNNYVYVATRGDAHKVDASDGSVVASFTSSTNGEANTISVGPNGNYIYVVRDYNGEVNTLEQYNVDGTGPNWTYSGYSSSGSGNPFLMQLHGVDNGAVYVAEDTTMYAINVSDRSVRWSSGFFSYSPQRPGALDESGEWFAIGERYYDASGNAEIHKATTEQVTKDPGVDVDGDGTDEVSYSGTLSGGSTHTEEVPELSYTDDDWTISTSEFSVDVSAEFTERVATENPEIDINGNPTSVSGIIADGNTADISDGVNLGWLENGGNTVDVTVSDAVDGPTGEVGVYLTIPEHLSGSIAYPTKTFDFVPAYAVVSQDGTVPMNAAVEYILTDGDGNTETITAIDEEVPVSFTSSDIDLEVKLNRGSESDGTPEIDDFAIYLSD